MLRTPTKGRAEQSLVLRKGTLDLPSLVKELFVKLGFHLPAIIAFGPFASASFVESDIGSADLQFLSTEAMVVFSIIGGIGQDRGKLHMSTRLQQGRSKLRRIVARTTRDNTAGKKMGMDVAHGGHFGPLAA